MSRREDIDNAIWSDPEFEALSPDATLLYLWSFTNPRCGMAGLYKVGRRAMTESKLEGQQLDQALAELADAGFVYYHAGVMWVRSRVKHLRTRTWQMGTSVVADIEKIDPANPLLRAFLDEYEGRWPLKLTEVRARVVEVHEIALSSSESVSLAEVHPNLQGKGKGKGVERTPSKDNGQVDARPEVLALCRRLADRIVVNDPKAKPAWESKGWLTACRLLLEADERSVSEVQAVIDWSQQDDFWRTNVLSMPTLRKQFSKLWLKMRSAGVAAAVQNGTTDPAVHRKLLGEPPS